MDNKIEQLLGTFGDVVVSISARDLLEANRQLLASMINSHVPQYMTPEEVKARTKFSDYDLKRAAKDGLLVPIVYGRTRVYSSADVVRFLEELRKQ